jgi:hypothetical protein
LFLFQILDCEVFNDVWAYVHYDALYKYVRYHYSVCFKTAKIWLPLDVNKYLLRRVIAVQGSCFVVYETKEGAEKFLQEPELKYNDEDLLVREYK